jgi:hypothetical protein
VDGPIENPRISLSAAGNGLGLDGIVFDRAMLSVTKKDNMLYLHELSLIEGSLLSSAYGSISFRRRGPIDIEANLKGNSVGLLNLLTNDFRWLSGNSSVSLKASGTLAKPQINGKAFLSRAAIRLNAIDSVVRDLQGSAEVRGNVLDIKSLTGVWAGGKTKKWANPIGLAGQIDFTDLFSEKPSLGLALVVSPTDLYVALPNLYTGNLSVKELSLSGPLYFDQSRGPLLAGKVAAENAVINLPSGQAPAAAGQPFPLDFDLTADLNKNVYAVMGDVSTLNLSNIFMNLELSGQSLKISGSTRSPVLLGKIALKRGVVSIFNREFTLLSTDMQSKFFPYDQEKIRQNTAFFTGEEGPSGALPNLDITASVNVENQEKDADGQLVKKNVVVLARLAGVPGSTEKERGLKVALSGFSEDKSKSPPEISPANYAEQDLRVMLLPDFIKSLAGISGPGESGKVDTNVIVADYLNSRVQTLLFRSLEREAEQRLGLESLTLEYNFGPKIREAMGIKDTTGFAEEKPALTVGFVKGFFDRLYIDVRYSQGVQKTTSSSGADTSINYQLTYKLTPIWSIIYYREPISLNEITTGYQKITLKAGFAIW